MTRSKGQICSSNIKLNKMSSYLDLSFDKGGYVILILKDGESLQQVMFQPFPVLCDLFTGGSCRGVRRESQNTQPLGSQEEHDGVMFQFSQSRVYSFVFLNSDLGDPL